MLTRRAFGRWRKALDLVLAVATVVLAYPLAADAQVSAPAELPHGPAKPGFDITRFSSAGNPWFETFYVKETKPLRDVLAEGKVATDTRVLVT